MITPTDMAIENLGADVRGFEQILSDLEKLQNDIKVRVTNGQWEGILDLVLLKGKWERSLAVLIDEILRDANKDFFTKLYEYSERDQEVVNLIESKMESARSEICKTVNARKVLTNFSPNAGNNLYKKIEKGSFLDRAG